MSKKIYFKDKDGGEYLKFSSKIQNWAFINIGLIVILFLVIPNINLPLFLKVTLIALMITVSIYLKIEANKEIVAILIDEEYLHISTFKGAKNKYYINNLFKIQNDKELITLFQKSGKKLITIQRKNWTYGLFKFVSDSDKIMIKNQ